MENLPYEEQMFNFGFKEEEVILNIEQDFIKVKEEFVLKDENVEDVCFAESEHFCTRQKEKEEYLMNKNSCEKLPSDLPPEIRADGSLVKLSSIEKDVNVIKIEQKKLTTLLEGFVEQLLRNNDLVQKLESNQKSMESSTATPSPSLPTEAARDKLLKIDSEEEAKLHDPEEGRESIRTRPMAQWETTIKKCTLQLENAEISVGQFPHKVGCVAWEPEVNADEETAQWDENISMEEEREIPQCLNMESRPRLDEEKKPQRLNMDSSPRLDEESKPSQLVNSEDNHHEQVEDASHRQGEISSSCQRKRVRNRSHRNMSTRRQRRQRARIIFFRTRCKKNFASRANEDRESHPRLDQEKGTPQQLNIENRPQLDEEKKAQWLNKDSRPQLDEEKKAQWSNKDSRPQLDEENKPQWLNKDSRPQLDEEKKAQWLNKDIRPQLDEEKEAQCLNKDSRPELNEEKEAQWLKKKNRPQLHEEKEAQWLNKDRRPQLYQMEETQQLNMDSSPQLDEEKKPQWLNMDSSPRLDAESKPSQLVNSEDNHHEQVEDASHRQGEISSSCQRKRVRNRSHRNMSTHRQMRQRARIVAFRTRCKEFFASRTNEDIESRPRLDEEKETPQQLNIENYPQLDEEKKAQWLNKDSRPQLDEEKKPQCLNKDSLPQLDEEKEAQWLNKDRRPQLDEKEETQQLSMDSSPQLNEEEKPQQLNMDSSPRLDEQRKPSQLVNSENDHHEQVEDTSHRQREIKLIPGQRQTQMKNMVARRRQYFRRQIKFKENQLRQQYLVSVANKELFPSNPPPQSQSSLSLSNWAP